MTKPWEFDEPAQGDRFTADEAQNKRLIIVPIEYVPQIRTKRNDIVDGIKVNVVDLEADGGPKTYWGALWFGGKLIQAFKPKIGSMFLGYVQKQPTGGGFTAWVFTSLTSDQPTVGMAQTWLQANSDFMETCQGDIRMAQANPQRPVEQPQQPATVQGWNQGQPTPYPQGQPQQQWGQSAQMPYQPIGGGYEARSQLQPPSQQPPQFNPQYTQQGPPPVQQQGPAPLPPQTAADPWPAQSVPQGNGPASAPSAPSSPAPVGGSVMDRLRAQRDQQSSAPPAQSDSPF